ncbi:hypothetical protein [Arthrobacter bambusae]|uniref:hypothetical protein n=1 Tax=Arthrobacter bambusae TaxID=1338426 RepID=UPI0027871D3A|nr:hypothetical protein [Arthrobacter bambusae]MDQ0029035.1 hypothetical protein [Arthrobacter bambusae]MDQ0098563.1 hypothetical protein [Arthrobacter bambusae]
MANTASIQFDQFLEEATITTHDRSTLGRDCFYGLYTSWCLLNRSVPLPENVFWAAVRTKGIHPDGSGLAMTGPAAADYILASYPGMG